MIRWVFLDVGNVLLDEDYLTFHVFRRHAEAICRVRPDLTPLDLIARREDLASAGSRWPLFDLASLYLEEREVGAIWEAVDREVRDDFPRWNRMIPETPGVIAELSRTYRLGLIANQPRPCRALLARLGLLDRFAEVVLSEEVGLRKPDPAIFRRALDRVGELPERCLMVGDRTDNDIVPALEVGMEAIRIRWPRREAKGWDGGSAEGRAYLASLTRLADLGETPACPGVDTVGDLPAAIGSPSRRSPPVNVS